MLADAMEHLAGWPTAVTLADADAEDCPLLFANAGFEALTGHAPGAVTGRNCRFLQAAETDRAEVARVRDAIRARQPVEACLLNRRADGSIFHNFLMLAPIRLGGGRTLFVGAQHEFDLAAARAERAAARGFEGFEARRTLLAARIGAAELGLNSVRMRSEAVRMLVQTYVQRALIRGPAAPRPR